MCVCFRTRVAQRYFILLEAVDGESQVYLRVCRCATGGLKCERGSAVRILENLCDAMRCAGR